MVLKHGRRSSFPQLSKTGVGFSFLITAHKEHTERKPHTEEFFLPTLKLWPELFKETLSTKTA
jgi:hypothetical protein